MKYRAAVFFGLIIAVILFWIGNTVWHDARLGYETGGWAGAFDHADDGLRTVRLAISTHVHDLLAGLALVGGAGLGWLYYIAERGRERRGEEHGSARWGRPRDIAPFINPDAERNLLLTRTERLTIDRPAKIQHQRNLNVMVIGAAGTGKSRNFILPNMARTHSSYLATDPKGELLAASGTALKEAGYQIRVLNLVNFAESDRFNPLAYLRPGHEPEDVNLMAINIIANTDVPRQQMAGGGDPFWERAEAGLLNALIGFVAATYPTGDQHLGSVMDLLLQMRASDDVAYTSEVDAIFEGAARMLADNPSMLHHELLAFAIANYRVYQRAAQKTAASIIVTMGMRLAPLHIPSVRRLVTADTLQLDLVGFEPTALFMVLPDTNKQFAWLSALMLTTFFQRGVWLADRQYSRRLPVPVMCFLDEFANIGKIPDFDILAATLRSRGISFQAVIQALGQGQALYRDGWKAILGNCDTVLFLGSADADTRKFISEALGKQTIMVTDSSRTKGRHGSDSRSRKSQGRELLTPDEVGRLPGDEAIVLIRGLPPFKSKKLAPLPETTPYRHQLQNARI